MLEQLNGDHTIIMLKVLKFIDGHVACHNLKICQTLLAGLLVDENLLCLRIRERGNLCIGEDLSKVERCGTPSTTSWPGQPYT